MPLKFQQPTNNCTTAFINNDVNKLTKLDFTNTRNTDPIIYSNYPEQIGLSGKGLAFAENGYYINQQTIPAGSAQMFFSHSNHFQRITNEKTTIYYRVQIYNPSGTATATVTRSNYGQGTGWTDPGDPIKQFFASTSTNFTLQPGKSAWLSDELAVAYEQPFSGLIRIKTDQPIVVTMYCYYTKGFYIDGTQGKFPYDSAHSADPNLTVYSGIGKGYFLNAVHGKNKDGQILVSDLKKLPYRFMTNKDHINTNELTPIKLVTGQTASQDAASPLYNLGNWCTQYYHKITIKNDTTSAATVYGYICSNTNGGNTQVIQMGSNIASVVLNNNHTWQWCRIDLAAGSSISFDYQTILASYGAAATYHEFSLNSTINGEA